MRETRLRDAGAVQFTTTRQLGDMRDEAALGRALAAAGLGPGALARCEQVHGARVAVVLGAAAAGAARGAGYPSADGLATAEPGVPLGVYTADCLAVFLYDPAGKRAAVLHAGWRGLAAGVLERGLEGFGAPAGVLAAVGPHICARCYEVGPEVAARFPRSCAGGKLDLEAEAVRRLLERGVAERNIERGAGCTYHEAERFFSYRRGERGSRMLSVICL